LSPIGNPQNLLIAIDGPVPSPFLTFFQALALPTLLNLMVAYVVLRVMWPTAFHATALVHSEVTIRDPALARLIRLALVSVFGLLGVKMICVALAVPLEFRLSYLAMAAALPLLVFSQRRLELVRQVDWPTLLFFASMFVLMASVWQTGVLQSWTAHLQMDFTSLPSILGAEYRVEPTDFKCPVGGPVSASGVGRTRLSSGSVGVSRRKYDCGKCVYSWGCQ
jgi:Na+/H+ antiporter NhaD/arsenite permease-like protein